jgi:hypothetical protein
MRVKSLKSKMERSAAANLESAQIIIAGPERYQGLMSEWAARTVVLFLIENPSHQGLTDATALKAAEIVNADPGRYPAMMQSWAASRGAAGAAVTTGGAAGAAVTLAEEDRREISVLITNRR